MRSALPTGSKSDMDFLQTKLQERGEICFSNSTSGKDIETTGGLLDERSKRRGPSQCRIGETGRQNPVDADLHQGLQCSGGVTCLVKRTMKGDAHGPGKLDQPGHLMLVDRSIDLQDAKNNTRRSK